ncbi:MAG: ABC transporter permease [Phycisphaerales bacterium]|nr:MAG: ABC transporter permease [Phycisphaerales bacterium]
MKNIWKLVKKDLLRDAKHPWGLVVFMIIPVMTAVIMSLVFSPQSDIQKNVTIDIAILDRDDDLLSGMLRSISNQGGAAENLKLHFVDTEEAGIRLVEKRKASAFVVLPKNLTVDLLEGTNTSIGLYKNPAEAILPTIVEEGLNIVCIGVSQALNLLQPEIKTIRKMLEQDEMPEPIEVANVASSSVERLKTIEPYLFPPLIQFETINASDYVQGADQDQANMEGPNQ